jgi:hypothetical protein
MLSTWTPITLYLWAMGLAGVGGVLSYLDKTRSPRPSIVIRKFFLHALAGGCIGGIGHEYFWTGKPATVVFAGAAYALGLNVRGIANGITGGDQR